MGAELNHLSKHNLDLTNLVALAKDISNRFKVNIRYGFEESPFVSSAPLYPEAEKRFDFYENFPNIIIGTINHPNPRGTGSLVEDDYLEKEICRKYGNTIPESFQYDEKQAGPWNTRFYDNESIYYLSGDGETLPSANIEKGGISFEFGHFSGWHHFNAIVFNQYNKNNLSLLNNYRKDIRRFTKLCGGTKAYHLMGSRGFEMMDTWAETEKHIIEHAGKELMDIVEVIERYHMNEEKLAISDCEEDKCFARAFIDDFRDLG